MRLHLVRHLAPQVADGVCYGRTDLGVDPARQALALPALRLTLPDALPVFSSPLQRCSSLAAALDPDARIDPRLAELDFGSWEMRRWDEIARVEVDAWAADVVHYRPGGGESVIDMARRIGDFYASIRSARHKSAVVVCHAGAIRLLLARQRDADPECMARTAAEHPSPIAYGEVVVIDCV
jgi:alpha-ribazole phosphatase